MKKLRSTLAASWRISIPYFRSEDRRAGIGLLAAVIGIELALVAINVLLNQWNNAFYNSLQERNYDDFVYQIGYFSVLAAMYIALVVYQLYLNQWLQIRWRTWMTRRYLGDWLKDATHYRMQLLGDAADNPDQRISDDVKQFVDQTLSIGVGFLSSVVTLLSFVAILWGLSNAAPLQIAGVQYNVPGYLVWGALIYSVIGTVLTHFIGRPLVNIDFRQQQYEADFRFNLMRVRENAEQIALLHGETAERARLLDRFVHVVDNWKAIMSRTKKVTALTAGFSQASVVFPYILVAPAFFAQKIQIGGMMQAASAFSSVQSAMSFFVTSYRQIALWQSILIRLDGFEASVRAAEALTTKPGALAVTNAGPTNDIDLNDAMVKLPTGRTLVGGDGLTLRNTESALVTGPSGSGKSTLFRAIAGIWPFGEGTISVPAGATLMMLPQRPYFPVGTLKAALAYPSQPDSFGADDIREALEAVGLPAMTTQLDEDAHWNSMLSLGEQQRLGVVRALLQKPDYLFLDEATASLDEPSEANLYKLIEQRLPNTTVVSIGHRSTLEAFHKRRIALATAGDHFVLKDKSETAQPA